MEAKFGKSKLGHATERTAHDLVLEDKRFQKPPREVKTRILELLGVKGDWSQQTFDLVMTDVSMQPITALNAQEHINRITLIEVKATRKPIRSCALSGFFFGSTERQYLLAAALGARYRYAFVVMNDMNDYGQQFFCLLSSQDVLERTQAKRTQFQVNFKSKMSDPKDPIIGPWPAPGGAKPVEVPSGAPVAGEGESRRKASGRAKPIRDTLTGQEYGSEGRAGKALHRLVGGDVNDTFVWFKIARAYPLRFETKNAHGQWVPLNDPSAPKGTTRKGS